MKILTLSGWGQPHDALAHAFPDATHLCYARHDTVEDALRDIADTARGHDTVIGWSLGGQLAARAISEGFIAPRKLVLIAAPFEFVEMGGGLGMPRDTFDKFFDNYIQNPVRTLHKAWDLVHYNDAYSGHVKEVLSGFSKQAVLNNDWLKWLSLIDGYSCEKLDFSRFPNTLLVHGEEDVVVEPAQSKRFAECIKGAKLELWPDCGHAPHWHDTNRLRNVIKGHLHV
ncbi:MAG: alpha/beta fold hydrolase [Rickettsiales bacterium]